LFGVKVYNPEVVLFIVGGFHVPAIPFGAIEFSSGGVSPEQSVIVGLKSDTKLFPIVIET
jgi:hypothetical protein